MSAGILLCLVKPDAEKDDVNPAVIIAPCIVLLVVGVVDVGVAGRNDVDSSSREGEKVVVGVFEFELEFELFAAIATEEGDIEMDDLVAVVVVLLVVVESSSIISSSPSSRLP